MFTTYKGSYASKAVSIISVFVLVAGIMPMTASADIDLDFISPINTTVTTNASVTYTLQGDTDGNGDTDDWRSTRITIEISGPDITSCVNVPNVTSDANNATASITVTAPSTVGDYTVVGRAYRQPNCASERDSKTTTLHVVAPAPVDVCPNVSGNQAIGPCADTLCVAPNTWNVGTQNCDAPPACPIGTVGVFPVCVPIIIPTCPEGTTGIFPICIPIPTPDVDLCPEAGMQTTLPCASITPDADTDGVSDETDNCPAVANADQLDIDNDGVGDACDETPNGEENQSPEPTEQPKKRGGHINAICEDSVDNDNDGLYDMNDPDCTDRKDSTETPEVGGIGNAEEVAGAACPVLNVYLGLSGVDNDADAVKVVQNFLNKELGLSLEINGEYDAATIEAVKVFQAKYSLDILTPWGIGDATGIVYKTTQRMINKISCPSLEIPMPVLN